MKAAIAHANRAAMSAQIGSTASAWTHGVRHFWVGGDAVLAVLIALMLFTAAKAIVLLASVFAVP
jgi:hypothetical protein